jgi:hypothetical protein
MGGGGGGASGAAAAADPFADQRAQYQDQLSKLMKDPSSITSDPGYQFQLKQGLDAVNGSMGAAGYLNSGNRLTALTKYGQDYASTQLQNKELFLAQLAGANVGSPGTAGQIMQSQNQLNQAAAGAVGNQIGGAISNFIGNGFNTGSTGGYNFTMPSGWSSGSASGYSGGGNTYGFNSGVSDPSYGVSYGFGV